MPYVENNDSDFVEVNIIEDSVISHSEPVSIFTTGQLHRLPWEWIVSERSNCGYDPIGDPRMDPTQVLFDNVSDFETVPRHPLSGVT